MRGRKLQFKMDIFQIIEILVPTLLLLLTGLLLFKLKSKYSWITKVTSISWTFYALIGLTIIGFLFSLDNNQAFGCIILETSVFSSDNIIYSGISVLLLTLAYINQDRKNQLLILSAELLFWLYKLFYLKGGYSVGITASAMFGVLYFDIIALTLRLILIKQVAKIRIKTIYMWVPMFLIIFIKVGHYF
jgi:hypothetical protein